MAQDESRGADEGLSAIQAPERNFSKKDSQVGGFMNENDIDALTDEYAKEDKSSTKTLSRIFVEKYLETVRYDYFVKFENAITSHSTG
jgi:hypothetical protein